MQIKRFDLRYTRRYSKISENAKARKTRLDSLFFMMIFILPVKEEQAK
jgi:hypothetical protein